MNKSSLFLLPLICKAENDANTSVTFFFRFAQTKHICFNSFLCHSKLHALEGRSMKQLTLIFSLVLFATAVNFAEPSKTELSKKGKKYLGTFTPQSKNDVLV